jgi:hypothetical protein
MIDGSRVKRTGSVIFTGVLKSEFTYRASPPGTREIEHENMKSCLIDVQYSLRVLDHGGVGEEGPAAAAARTCYRIRLASLPVSREVYASQIHG